MTWFTAYADLDGTNLDPIPVRKKALIKMALKFFPFDYDEAKCDHWVGLRPVSPDDCPIIGKSSIYRNLYFNCGQASWGIAISLGSGALLENMLQKLEAPTGLDYTEFNPKRFGI